MTSGINMRNLIAIITVLIAFSRTTFIGEIMPSAIYYGWFIFLALLVILRNLYVNKINPTMVYFLAVCLLSIILNEINPIFVPWQRFTGFVLFIIAVGPFFESEKTLLFRYKLFHYANYFIVTITITSFLGYVFRYTAFFNQSGFSGLTNQSMVLGPIAGFSMLISLYYLFNAKNKKQKVLLIAIIIISFLTCLLAASRGALFSLVVSSVFLIFITYRKSKRKFVTVFIVSAILILSTFNFWLPYAENVILKNQSRVETDNILSGRETMWKDRIEDFKYSPIYGVGFASMKNDFNSKINIDGTFEPGSGWLFILSSLGLLGFITFVILFIKPIIIMSLKMKVPFAYSNLIVCILVFFIFHLLIEGYVLSTGGFLSFYIWLSIAMVQKRSIQFLRTL
jgi:O-antigen ligase